MAIGGSLGAEKAQMYEVVGYATRELGGEHERKPRHLLGIGEVDDLIRGVELGIDTFDCAMPTRLGRHGTALVPDPANRWRVDLTEGSLARVRGAAAGGLRVPGLRRRCSRAPTSSYLVRAGELTGARLLTMHNLAFLARLMKDLRGGILDGDLENVARGMARRRVSPQALSYSGTTIDGCPGEGTRASGPLTFIWCFPNQLFERRGGLLDVGVDDVAQHHLGRRRGGGDDDRDDRDDDREQHEDRRQQTAAPPPGGRARGGAPLGATPGPAGAAARGAAAGG